MSDPTIQTFCCRHTGSKEDLAVRIMDEFNTESYNTVCLVSSTIGILGSIYQIFPCGSSNRQERLRNVTSNRGRHIIIWLAVADLLASLGEENEQVAHLMDSTWKHEYFHFMPIFSEFVVPTWFELAHSAVWRAAAWLYFCILLVLQIGVLVRSSLWLRYKNIMPQPDDDTSVLFCSITSAWTQYFYTATWFWTLFYAIDTLHTIKGRDSYSVLYHSIAWGVPAATTGIGLSILYIPNATCHNLKTVTSAFFRILPNYFATYLPIAMVMIVNPILYILAGKEVEMTVALPLAQFTSKERRVVDALKLKFFLINAVFYICWLPNLINGIMIWTMWFNMPVKIIISIWYIMALMNPLQALLNALVYRRWNTNGRKYRPMFPSIQKEFNIHDEQSPLLGSEPPRLQLSPLPPSINNYATM